MNPTLIDRLRRQLDSATKSDLAGLTPKVAAWMQPIIRQITGPL
ncbi:MAG TPA: hypothetical protein VFC28_03120 [Opitutaceae bacterium]|jgi:hypothetical protein|nr:hypothetical protein [Opitutaceae bacterium]